MNKRVGLLVPSSNTVAEDDFRRAMPAGVTLHVARARLAICDAEHERKMIEEYVPLAAEDLGTAKVHLLHFSCTSAAALLGDEGEKRFMASLAQKAGTPKITSTMWCVSETLEKYRGSKVAVVTPYVDELTDAVAGTITERGFDVVAKAGMGIIDNFELATPTPDDIAEFIRTSLKSVSFDLIFISCTNFRGVEAREAVADEFGVPVVTSNQASIEVALRKLSE